MNTSQHQIQISALTAVIQDGAVPTDAHLLPAQDFKPDDGRKLPVPKFLMSAEIAQRVIARLSARHNDALVDYEHQSLFARENGQKVIAAGWFHEMEFRSDGLWATNIGWTDTAKAHIAAKEYRYISAVFTYNKTTGEILEIISVALTNTPAMDGLQALASLTNQFNETLKTGDSTMSDKDLAALTAERDGLQTQLAALTTERDGLQTQVFALTAERDAANTKLAEVAQAAADAAQAAAQKQKDDLIKAALTDGRLAPAQKAWAEKLDTAALTEYLDTAPELLSRRQSGDENKGEHGLTAEELEMCSRQGVTHAEFLAAKTKAAG